MTLKELKQIVRHVINEAVDDDLYDSALDILVDAAGTGGPDDDDVIAIVQREVSSKIKPITLEQARELWEMYVKDYAADWE